MIRSVILCISMTCALGASGCAAGSSARLQTSLLETDRQWAEAVRGDDADRIASFWTDDAVIYTSGRPPVAGKEALQAFVAQNRSKPGFSLGWEVTEFVIADSGDLAYTLGPYTLKVPTPRGDVVTQKGNHICVWRRENGNWRCMLEVHAALPPKTDGAGSRPPP